LRPSRATDIQRTNGGTSGVRNAAKMLPKNRAAFGFVRFVSNPTPKARQSIWRTGVVESHWSQARD
jgi:hypothetical protein